MFRLGRGDEPTITISTGLSPSVDEEDAAGPDDRNSSNGRKQLLRIKRQIPRKAFTKGFGRPYTRAYSIEYPSTWYCVRVWVQLGPSAHHQMGGCGASWSVSVSQFLWLIKATAMKWHLTYHTDYLTYHTSLIAHYSLSSSNVTLSYYTLMSHSHTTLYFKPTRIERPNCKAWGVSPGRKSFPWEAIGSRWGPWDWRKCLNQAALQVNPRLTGRDVVVVDRWNGIHSIRHTHMHIYIYTRLMRR